MGFLGNTFKQVFYSAMLLLSVILLNFLLIHMAPGDPVDVLVGEMGGATEEIISQIRKDYGFDKSFSEQMVTYVLKMARGDMGMSFTHRRPVVELILERVPATFILVLVAIVTAVVLGTLLGVMAARKPHGLFSDFVTFFSLITYSAPGFWTGIMLIIAFCYVIPIFPSFGMITVGMQGGTIARAADLLKHLVLPVVTLAGIYLAAYSRLARASMLDVLSSDYIRTARAKGLSERAVVYQHALKNAVLPVVTMAGLQFSQVLAGAIVIETVFSWPGMGQLTYQAIMRRDHTLLLGILFFSTGVVVVINLLTDICYRFLDPRIKKVTE
jgi:peptide/nickel transport system permease protein